MAETTTKKDERVDVFVPKGLANDDPNLYVSINDMEFLLPRGQVSRVPAYVKAAIERSYGAQAMLGTKQHQLAQRLKITPIGGGIA